MLALSVCYPPRIRRDPRQSPAARCEPLLRRSGSGPARLRQMPLAVDRSRHGSLTSASCVRQTCARRRINADVFCCSLLCAQQEGSQPQTRLAKDEVVIGHLVESASPQAARPERQHRRSSNTACRYFAACRTPKRRSSAVSAAASPRENYRQPESTCLAGDKHQRRWLAEWIKR